MFRPDWHLLAGFPKPLGQTISHLANQPLCRVWVGCTLLMLLSEFASRVWFGMSFLPGPLLALGDVPFNLAGAVLAVLPLLVGQQPKTLAKLLVWAGFLTVAIDLDHFVMAGSWHLKDVISLPHRPWTHSFVVATLFSLLVWVVGRSRLAGAVAWLALTAHLLRDAFSGFNLLYFPFDKTPHTIDTRVCLGLLVLLPTLAVWLRGEVLSARPGLT